MGFKQDFIDEIYLMNDEKLRKMAIIENLEIIHEKKNF